MFGFADLEITVPVNLIAAILLILALLLVVLSALILILSIVEHRTWKEKEKLKDVRLDISAGAFEITTSKRLSIEETMRFAFKGNKGYPIFVFPVSELKRLQGFYNVDLHKEVDEKQFITISPIYWTLDNIYYLHYKDSDETFCGVIRPGVITDFASIPIGFRWLAGQPTSMVVRAAIVHDYGYRYGKDRDSTDRKKWDRVLLEIMRNDELHPLRRSVIYTAVRLFGSGAWKRNTKNRLDEEYIACLDNLQVLAKKLIEEYKSRFDQKYDPVEPQYHIETKSTGIFDAVIEAQNKIIKDHASR